MKARMMAAALVAAVLVSANAWASPDWDPTGRPKSFDQGDVAKYAVWKSEKGWWHVLWTTAGKRKHEFSGHVDADGGKFTDVKSHALEACKDWVVVGPERHKIGFKTQTDGGIDGFSFQVGPKVDRIGFTLKIDDKRPEGRIFVGRDGHHPKDDPFWIKEPNKY